MTYGIGRELTYRDRFEVKKLLASAKEKGYKLQEMIVSVCLSPVLPKPSHDNPMKPKSWNINRRQFVRGGGVALALPFLQGMSWGKTAGEGPAEADGGELHCLRSLRTED